MNWRYHVGSAWNRAVEETLSNRVFPLTRYVPSGRRWLYDVQRFAGTRDLSVIFDVGANVGQTAWSLVRYFSGASIYCFEPVSETMAQLQASYGRYKNVHFVQQALGSQAAQIVIPLHKSSELNTLVSDQPRTHDLTGAFEMIEIDTLDAFCVRKQIRRIDVLKMDVQGWELEVLNGASRLLSENGIRFVMAEVGFRRADTDMQHFAELNDRMVEYGYWLCGFYHQYRWGDAKQFLGFSDALYINPTFNTR